MLKKILLSSMFLALSTACTAQVTSPEVAKVMKVAGKDVSVEVVTEIVTKVGPNVGGEITSISKTPINNLYELIANKNIIYVTGDGEYVLQGNLYQSLTKANLTKMKLDTLNVLDFNQLPLDLAMKKVKGNGSRVIAVFSDPDCPFCKKLENEVLPKIDNVTIYTFLLPLTDLHPNAKVKSENIWCSKDPVKSWDDWMLNGKVPAKVDKSKCKLPLDTIGVLAKKNSIYGTPTIVIKSNNRLVSGALPAYELEKLMKQ